MIRTFRPEESLRIRLLWRLQMPKIPIIKAKDLDIDIDEFIEFIKQ
jgi:hypothetical protein